MQPLAYVERETCGSGRTHAATPVLRHHVRSGRIGPSFPQCGICVIRPTYRSLCSAICPGDGSLSIATHRSRCRSWSNDPGARPRSGNRTDNPTAAPVAPRHRRRCCGSEPGPTQCTYDHRFVSTPCRNSRVFDRKARRVRSRGQQPGVAVLLRCSGRSPPDAVTYDTRRLDRCNHVGRGIGSHPVPPVLDGCGHRCSRRMAAGTIRTSSIRRFGSIGINIRVGRLAGGVDRQGPGSQADQCKECLDLVVVGASDWDWGAVSSVDRR